MVFVHLTDRPTSLTPVLNISKLPSPESFPVIVDTEAATSQTCPQHSRPCPGSSTCIAVAQFCDGKKDCPKGLDEICVDACPLKSKWIQKEKVLASAPTLGLHLEVKME